MNFAQFWVCMRGGLDSEQMQSRRDFWEQLLGNGAGQGPHVQDELPFKVLQLCSHIANCPTPDELFFKTWNIDKAQAQEP